MEKCKIIILLLFLFSICESANILYLIPFSAKSHYISLRAIGLELAQRGHNVTVITSNTEDEHPPNYRQVVVDRIEIWDLIGGKRPNVFETAQMSTEQFHHDIIWKGGVAYTEVTLNSTKVKEFLAEDNHFDVVISEQFFNEALNLLAHRYNAPLILVTSYGNCMRHNIIARNPLELANTRSELLEIRQPHSFWGRFRNFYFSVYEFLWWRFVYIKQQEQLAAKYIKVLPEPVPSLYDMEQNAALVLMNSHFSFDPPKAHLPNFVEIGGSHFSKSEKKLPHDLQQLLDKSVNGVVYVNFGSNVRSSELPPEKKAAFINVFRKMKQTIIWKWEDNELENKPDNWVLRPWLPQKEILGHPNIKVFIGHGGLIGVQEAIMHGIPIIGIPVYGDQYNNLLKVQNHGFGKILQLDDINEDSLADVLNEVLTNNMYMKNAKIISDRFKDRPMPPLETAMYWIEYVIRHKGADFMKSPALNFNWFAFTMLDVYVVVVFVVLVIVFIIYKIIKTMRVILCKITKCKTNKRKSD